MAAVLGNAALVTPASYDVHAVRFATAPGTRAGYYLRFASYGVPDAPLACDYYFWVIRGRSTVTLVDTGFTEPVARRRGKEWLMAPAEGLRALDLAPADVSAIVLSHLHYDHCGNLEAFPAAEIFVQDAELDFWTGPVAERELFANLAEREYLNQLVKAESDGRLRLLRGDAEIAGGITALALGGHTPGQQAVRVQTVTGPVVLASDAVHFYDELRHDWPFYVVTDLPGMYAAYDRLRAIEAEGAVIVAGHDAEVMTRFDTRTLKSGGDLIRLA